MTANKLSFGTKIGYSSGSIARLGENIFYFYFVLFLTTVVGIPPAIAGTISLIAIWWDAITDPIVGYLSDNSKSKYGKRRPFMLASAIPLALLSWLLFINVDFGTTGNIIYFTIIGILFWTFYTVYLIPYDSFGSELTQDSTERAVLRSYCTAGIYVSVIVGGSGMILLKGYLEGSLNFSEATSWNISGAVMAFFILLVTIIAWRVTRGKEPINVEVEKRESLIKAYREIFKLKPFRTLAIFGITFFAANSMIATATVYLVTFKLGLGEGFVSTLFLIGSLTVFVTIPFANILIRKVGKKRAIIYGTILFAIVILTIYVKGVNGAMDAYTIQIAFSILNTIVLNASFSMAFDIGELSEFISGKARSVTIFALFSLSMKIGAGVGQWLLGILLQFGEFDGMAVQQTESANTWIVNLSTIIPGVLIAVGLIAIIFYKLGRKEHAAIVEALELKKQNKEYSTEGFKEVI